MTARYSTMRMGERRNPPTRGGQASVPTFDEPFDLPQGREPVERLRSSRFSKGGREDERGRNGGRSGPPYGEKKLGKQRRCDWIPAPAGMTEKRSGNKAKS
jgi:hypothetical protein